MIGRAIPPHSDTFIYIVIQIVWNLNANAPFKYSRRYWAKVREGELTEALKIIKAELIGLETKLAEKEAALAALTHFTQGLAPILSGLAAAYPLYSSLITPGGLIFGSSSLATTTALIIEIGMLKSQISQKTKQKGEMEAELEAIRQAREELEQTGTASVASFGDIIAAIPAVSTAAVGGANKILDWLKDGAPEQARNFSPCIDRTVYAQANLDIEARSFKSMAEYVRGFGQGISSVCDRE